MFLIQSVIRNHKVKIQSVLKSHTVKMTIINQIAKYHKVSHVIFDMDGLLLETEQIYEKIIRDLAASYGKPYPWEVRMRILGTTERRTCEIAVAELGLPCTVDEFQKQFSQSCLDNLGNCNLMNGAERIVRHFYNNNVPFCLATSSSQESVVVKTANYPALFKLFHHKVCGSTDPDVKQGKPAPDIFLVACQRFPGNIKPEDCLVFEDAPNGCRAAKLAGMQVVMVPDSHVTEKQKEDATVVLKNLLHFKPEEFGLPPFADINEE
ncbi:unnamed protein product [Chironomus riparius]|uniref:Pseudouridine-5'-phosphatase n=1 Tax=Chironomus riparius TaxID=315576 RepID=A0A9N9S2A4_9DIPT|nr:unnamed protein product [Chironomus riparius]